MNINITKTEKPFRITILHLDGILDGSNYKNLVVEAQKVHADGARDLILDLSKLTFISSAGLGALHQVALLFRGKKHPKKDESWGAYRWAAYRSLESDHLHRFQEHVKLVSPTKEVRELLDMIGFTSLFEIYTDLHLATASFYQSAQPVDAGQQ
jgi:anti-anti-sigma regulatory factor